MKVKALLQSNFTIDERINNLKISRIRKSEVRLPHTLVIVSKDPVLNDASKSRI